MARAPERGVADYISVFEAKLFFAPLRSGGKLFFAPLCSGSAPVSLRLGPKNNIPNKDLDESEMELSEIISKQGVRQQNNMGPVWQQIWRLCDTSGAITTTSVSPNRFDQLVETIHDRFATMVGYR